MPGGGTFIDTDSEPGSWADALRWPPFIDLEHDGTLFANIAFLTPDTAFECPFQLSEDGGKPDACRVIPDVLGLHADPIAKTNRDNPHGR